MSTFPQVILFTDTDGRARFREAEIPLSEGSPAARLSALLPATACQLRQSPVGFRSEFHCTGDAQWLFVLQGCMEIGLQDGSWRALGRASISTRPTRCPPGPASTPRCTATAAGRWATNRW